MVLSERPYRPRSELAAENRERQCLWAEVRAPIVHRQRWRLGGQEKQKEYGL